MYGYETGKRVSTTKLGKLLAAWGFVDKPFTTGDLKRGTVKGVSNETYDKDSRIYVYTGCTKRRRELERKLRSEGLRVSDDYHPGSGTVEVAVTYFRGDRHWE